MGLKLGDSSDRLQAAGAVLIAKLATGEMAFDDVWWGGKVKNPWNLDEGSSGSSAGPAAAVVAGAVAFAVRGSLFHAQLELHIHAWQQLVCMVRLILDMTYCKNTKKWQAWQQARRNT